MLRLVLYLLITLAWITYLIVAYRGSDDEDDPGPVGTGVTDGAN